MDGMQMDLGLYGSIDWSHPRLEQLEKFAAENAGGCKVTMEPILSHMSIVTETRKGGIVVLRPCFEKNWDDTEFRWYVVMAWYPSREKVGSQGMVYRFSNGEDDRLLNEFCNHVRGRR